MATPTADANPACSAPKISRNWLPALLLLSYPLHPPRKPDQLRTQHLSDLHTPTLFVQGTRDPFGSIAEIEQALKIIPAKTKLLAVEGAGHDLGFKGKAKQEELPRPIFSKFTEFFNCHPERSDCFVKRSSAERSRRIRFRFESAMDSDFILAAEDQASSRP